MQEERNAEEHILKEHSQQVDSVVCSQFLYHQTWAFSHFTFFDISWEQLLVQPREGSKGQNKNRYNHLIMFALRFIYLRLDQQMYYREVVEIRILKKSTLENYFSGDFHPNNSIFCMKLI